MPRPALSVIGLGKLGAPFAAVMAARGFKVVGVDRRVSFVRAINKGQAPVPEPQLQEFIKKGRKNLTATTSFAEAIKNSSITFIVVPTPSGKDGMFSNALVLEAVKKLAAAIKEKKERHVVVITSTVMPGSCDGAIRDALEKYSGKTVGKDVGLCYNPEFIALGSVIHDMLHPDFILIGEADKRSGKQVAEVYRAVCGQNTVIKRMNCINAEIAKLSINTFITTKISYANMLADVCERLPNADIDAVTSAVGADSRIGSKYLKGATAYGGPCFPRDNIALCALASKLGARMDLSKATHALNEHQTQRLVKRIEKLLPAGGHVGIAGMAYKPSTPVIERSAGMALAAALLKEGYRVTITDPLAMKAARDELKGRAAVAPDIKALAMRVDALVIMTPLAAYTKLTARSLAKRKKTLLLLDCWRFYKPDSLGGNVTILGLGRGKTSA